MNPVCKSILLVPLLYFLSALPLFASQLNVNSNLESKTNPRLNSITSRIVDDFLVNEDTGKVDQYRQNIASDSSGNFRIVWLDYRNYRTDIYSQLYTSSGVPVGLNLRLTDDSTVRWRYDLAFNLNSSGNFVCVWACDCDHDSLSNVDIYAQIYDADGITSGNPIKANDDTENAYQGFPEVAIEDFGRFAVVWYDSRNGNLDIYAQRFDSTGLPIDGNFKVNDDTGPAIQQLPVIATSGYGSYVIAWSDERNGKWDIYTQRFNSSGTAIGSNFRVNDVIHMTYPGRPSVGIARSGRFVITWQDMRNGDYDIYFQLYDSAGTALGTNIRVDDDTGKADQGYPLVAIESSGNFVITWEDFRSGNSDIYAQRYNSVGNCIGKNYLVNDPLFSSFIQRFPAVATAGQQIYYAWQDNRNNRGKDIYGKVLPWNWPFPHIELSPQILNFIAVQNGALPPAQSFTILNRNGGTFNWSLSHKAAWLEVSPDSGSGDSTIISVNVNRTDSLPFASYDTIVVISPDADNNPQIIPVNYYLSPSPSGPDPGIPDTVSVERMANVPPNTHLPPLHVYLTNDEPIAAYTIPLAFPDSIHDYDVTCDSVSFAGTRTDARALDVYPVVDNNRNLLFIPAIWFAGQLDPGNGPIAKIYFSTGLNWRTEYSVPINATIWPGGAEVPQGIGLQCVDYSGQFAWTPVFKAGALEVRDQEEVAVPPHFELSQNYPNPFNPSTRIQFGVGSLKFGEPVHTALKIYNILGQLVRTLVDEEKAPGNYEAIWDGKDDSGKDVSSGIYFYQLKTEDYTSIKKMVLLR